MDHCLVHHTDRKRGPSNTYVLTQWAALSLLQPILSSSSSHHIPHYYYYTILFKTVHILSHTVSSSVIILWSSYISHRLWPSSWLLLFIRSTKWSVLHEGCPIMYVHVLSQVKTAFRPQKDGNTLNLLRSTHHLDYCPSLPVRLSGNLNRELQSQIIKMEREFM